MAGEPENTRPLLGFLTAARRAKLYPILLLLGLDLALALVAFRNLGAGRGLMAYGDLPGIYTYGPLNSTWIGTVSTYPLSDLVVSAVAGPFTGQNVAYLAALFAPSIGLYVLAESLTTRRYLAVAVAFTFGTVTNPLLATNFLNGAYEFCYWVAFTAVAIRFVWSAVRGVSVLRNMAIAAVFLGLAVTQPGLLGLSRYISLVLAALTVFPLVLFEVEQNWLPRWRGLVSGVLFLGIFLLMVLATVVLALADWSGVSHSSAQLSAVNGYVLSNARFTFDAFPFPNAYLNAPFHPAISGWYAASSIPWELLAFVTLLLGLWVCLLPTHPDRWLARYCLAAYLTVAAVMTGINSGLLLGLFSVAKPLDVLDDPLFYQYVQLLMLPPLLVLGADRFLDRWRSIPFRIRWETRTIAVAAGGRRRRVASVLLVDGRSLPPRARHALVVGAILLAGLLTIGTLSPDLGGDLRTSPWVEYGRPFAPVSWAGVHDWYQSTGQYGGRILVLPYTYSLYTQIQAFLPIDRMWLIPFLGDFTNASYHRGEFISVMELLANGSGDAFGEAIGLAGVSDVVLLNTGTPVTLVPTYLQYPNITRSEAQVSSALSHAANLVASEATPAFTVYHDLAYLPPHSTQPTLTGFNAPGGVPVQQLGQALLNPHPADPKQFPRWQRWPTGEVTTQPNNTVALHLSGSAPIPYALFTDVLRLTPRTTTGTLPGANVTLNSSTLEVQYTVFANVSIPAGVYFEVLFYWYNVSQPTPLYSEFAITTAANFSQMTHQLELVQLVPAAAVSARLYFYLAPQRSSVNATAYLQDVSVTQSLGPTDLTFNATSELMVERQLENANATAESPFLLFGPYAGAAQPATDVNLYAAAALDPSASPDFNVTPSAWYTLGGTGSTTTLFLSGTAASAGAVTMSTSGSTQSTPLPSGRPWIVGWHLPTPVPSRVWINLTGTLSLFAAGFVVAAPTPAGASHLGTVPLPVGEVDVTLAPGGGVQVDRTLGAPAGGLLTGVILASDWLPILVVAGTIFLLTRPGRRTYSMAIRTLRKFRPGQPQTLPIEGVRPEIIAGPEPPPRS